MLVWITLFIASFIFNFEPTYAQSLLPRQFASQCSDVCNVPGSPGTGFANADSCTDDEAQTWAECLDCNDQAGQGDIDDSESQMETWVSACNNLGFPVDTPIVLGAYTPPDSNLDGPSNSDSNPLGPVSLGAGFHSNGSAGRAQWCAIGALVLGILCIVQVNVV
ncbi:hypothetical protein C8R44DRAFT_774472 [Mycena epipterygia]|nr:hypothetical protein C8R44DRAFT_774472 [Mycena epipterygia]